MGNKSPQQKGTKNDYETHLIGFILFILKKKFFFLENFKHQIFFRIL